MPDLKQRSIDRECDIALCNLANGDKSALSVIYDRYARLMLSVAYSITENYCDAQDVLQESMIELLRYASSYEAKSNPRAYILTIVRHCAIDLVRRRRLDSSLEENENVPIIEDSFGTFEVIDMLRKLSLDERQVIVLHLYGGLPHRQIAKIMGISTASSEKKYQRSLKKLKKYYESRG